MLERIDPITDRRKRVGLSSLISGSRMSSSVKRAERRDKRALVRNLASRLPIGAFFATIFPRAAKFVAGNRDQTITYINGPSQFAPGDSTRVKDCH